jgi:hypothetical protein
MFSRNTCVRVSNVKQKSIIDKSHLLNYLFSLSFIDPFWAKRKGEKERGGIEQGT